MFLAASGDHVIEVRQMKYLRILFVLTQDAYIVILKSGRKV